MTSSSTEKLTIKAIPERPAVAASESLSEFSVLVGLKAPSLSDDAQRIQRAPIDLVAVLDVSGSMQGSKMSLMKSAVHFIIDNLGPSDRLSIVSFNSSAQTISPLSRMTDMYRENARRAVDCLYASGGTNIVDALNMGVKVLEDSSQPNPVSTIIFLSDGVDTCNCSHLQATFPVHTFGFGTDHDPVVMHAISDASGGTFSFIQSHVMLQDAFASCIGGLLSVVTQDLCLNLTSASHGVEIKSIPSGRYASETFNQGSRGTLKIGDLYADEEKEFLINLSIPSLPNADSDDDTDGKTSLLEITCSYRNMVSNEMVQVEVELVEIRRPKSVSPQDMVVNLEIERQRNRLLTLLTITEAQQMAEMGNMAGAQAALSKGRSELRATACGHAGDPMCMWLDAEMEETRKRMATSQEYMQHGRAYALAGMSSHASQRAATRGNNIPGAAAFVTSPGFGVGQAPTAHSYFSSSAPSAPSYGCALPPGCPRGYEAYATPTMANMVANSKQQSEAKRVSCGSPSGNVPTSPVCGSDSHPFGSAAGYVPTPAVYAPPSYAPYATRPFGCSPIYVPYATPTMANMVAESNQQSEVKKVTDTGSGSVKFI